jgi:mitochondrial distribution and morphology protein 10
MINLGGLRERRKNGWAERGLIPEVCLYSLEPRPGRSSHGIDYLLYGKFYLPSGRLDALYSTRLGPTLQASVAAISVPQSSLPADGRGRRADPSNLMFNLQHDVGKWCTEYSYSAEDSMWGVRVLHNFGRIAGANGHSPNGNGEHGHVAQRAGVKRVDEEDAVEGGLRGRVSMGAELYFSGKEKSAGGTVFLNPPNARIADSQE